MEQVNKSYAFSKLDPCVKIISVCVFCFSVSYLKYVFLAFLAILFVSLFVIISGISIKKLSRNYAIASLFIFFASVSIFVSYLYSTNNLLNALSVAFVLFLRASTCVLAIILLMETTPEDKIMKGLRRLGLPDLIVKMLFFTSRYIHVLSEEKERMMVARRARLYSEGRSFRDKVAMNTISSTAGMLLVKAYKRGERIYDAMVARGYDGNIPNIPNINVSSKNLSKENRRENRKNLVFNSAFAFSFIFISVILVCMQYLRYVN